MCGGDHVDAAVEEAHGLEGEAVSVSAVVGGLAVEDDAHALGGEGPDAAAHVLARLFQVAHHGARVVRARAPELHVVVDLEVVAGGLEPGVLVVRQGLVGQAPLVGQLPQALLRRRPPGREVLARGGEEGFEVIARRLVAAPMPVEERQVPVRLGVRGLVPQHALEHHRRPRGLARAGGLPRRRAPGAAPGPRPARAGAGSPRRHRPGARPRPDPALPSGHPAVRGGRRRSDASRRGRRPRRRSRVCRRGWST